MTRSALLATCDPRGDHWQLGSLPPSQGRLWLVGWSVAPEPRDAGVPREVALVISLALTSVAQVTFLGLTPDRPTTTRAPETVLPLFDDPDYPWWLQAQVVLLSAPTAAPPNLDRRDLL